MPLLFFPSLSTRHEGRQDQSPLGGRPAITFQSKKSQEASDEQNCRLDTRIYGSDLPRPGAEHHVQCYTQTWTTYLIVALVYFTPLNSNFTASRKASMEFTVCTAWIDQVINSFLNTVVLSTRSLTASGSAPISAPENVTACAA